MDSQDNHNSEQSANNRSSDTESSNNQSNENSAGDSNYETPNTDPQLLSRHAEESEYYRSFLEQLLDLVFNEDQETVARLVSIIRSGASQQEILAVMSQVQNGNTGHVGENGLMTLDDQAKHGEN
ncbi:hypothetical protein ETB97_010800 [Aspergillus alliaceus]|uniref:Uncharacterized protein n=1 Tax=Petromyces alliaceus TaxID=209559 RepID=A0A5N7BRN2_PETAA|nr:uncharacterized protein BDW43DRAFT_313870 [Aspergillus alliaceus]KAB8230609.1 hypothetical protein BDW43DRAFT_313870 [Aspergillus alliaceus]KAE8384491.1 hypothetical protein BDV23DRAFT_189173 [Aspergillus alliaceus]KAF5866701.1 hypothetical protein ETB97_010800 [Aspergillus burnettii]